MNLAAGIVGLPNVGKSTLFNALLKKQVANIANYPFCTIEPNVGIVEVPDERLPVLAKVVGTEKITPAVVEFIDIAGLVRGASQGEGLGNKFLSHIREVAIIVHVVRIFEDDNVTHVSNKIDPYEDIQTVEAELILADLATIDKQPEPKGKADKETIQKYEVIKRVRKELNTGVPARNIQLTLEDIGMLADLNLLTVKPVIYVINISEKQLEDSAKTESSIVASLSKINNGKAPYLFFSAKMENEIAELDVTDQTEYLKQYNLKEAGLNRLIKKAYETLGLISFLTAGEIEARAWTITKGTLAPQAAAVIHTDFEKHFIKADVIPYQSFVDSGGWIKARETGKVQTVGREYEMKDGEVVEFKVGI